MTTSSSIVESRFKSGPLRIAMFSIHSSPTGELGRRDTGGMSTYIKALARELAGLGHRIDIFTCAPGPSATRSLGDNVRLIHLFSSAMEAPKVQLPDQVDRIFDLVERYRRTQQVRYDLVHSHYWISGMVGARARTHWNCPHVMTFHTLGLLKNMLATGENEPRRRIVHEQWLTSVADRIIVPLEFEKECLLRYYHADPRKLCLLPCGVDLNRFRILDRASARKRLEIAESTELLLYVGRFAPLKGLDRLIEAVAQLKISHPDLQLMVVGGDGGGDGAGGIQDLGQNGVARRNPGGRVRLIGRVEHGELPHYYAAADVMVQSSQYESFGLVVLEALACGLPVAATPVGVAGTVIRRGVNGILFDGDTAKDMAAGLADILNRPAGQRLSRQRIRAGVLNFGWEHVGAGMAEIYRHVLGSFDGSFDSCHGPEPQSLEAG